mgnify:CR=1 FL=1
MIQCGVIVTSMAAAFLVTTGAEWIMIDAVETLKNWAIAYLAGGIGFVVAWSTS